MGDLVYEDVAVFIDDILIGSATFQRHLTNLEKVLHPLQEMGLTLIPSNCKSAVPLYKVLGFQLRKNEAQQDPAKIIGVRDLSLPRTTRDVRFFVELCSFYQTWIPIF